MGPAIVFFIWLIAMTVVATCGAAVLGIAAFALTRRATAHRARAVIAAAAFPYGCVLFAAVWFFACATIRTSVFHRDMGIGDTWQTPLPNGYAILMIDTTDQGTLFDPKTQSTDSGVTSQGDTIEGVRQLQVAGKFLLGARDSEFEKRFGQDSSAVDTYFLFDTQSKTAHEFRSLSGLQSQAAKAGIALRLRPIIDVYNEYGFTWFDYVADAAIPFAVLVGFTMLVRYVWRVRRSGMITYVDKRA